MREILVTTSWDDGHRLDMRVAELLAKYGLRGTFYVAPSNHELSNAERLAARDIKALAARGFEIGAHTMTHPHLARLAASAQAYEISASKAWLEDATGAPVVSFCYPYGNYNASAVDAVRAAGFSYGRTVVRHAADTSQSLTAGTSVHAYRHWRDLPAIAKLAGARPGRFWRYLRDWSELAIASFEASRTSGQPYHLWGHSWEVDQHGDWHRLERVLAHIAATPGIIPATNGELA